MCAWLVVSVSGFYDWASRPVSATAVRRGSIGLLGCGRGFGRRVGTRVGVPSDPLIPLDPIFLSDPERARDCLVAAFDLELTQEGIALGFRFDIVLRGQRSTFFENRPEGN